MESFTCLYSISEEGSCIHYRVTGQQRYLVALRQGSVRVELQYSVIVFCGSNFSWCFNFHGFNFVVKQNHKN